MNDAPGAIVWIASYPRSGNTWVRAFLRAFSACLPTGRWREEPIASDRRTFDEVIGVSSRDLGDHDAAGLRPAVYRALSAAAGDHPVVVKIHDSFDLKLVPADATRAVIHLVRDPRDVADSWASYNGRSVDWAIDFLNNTRSRLGGTGEQLAQSLGGWSDHVRSWMNAPLPSIMVRYEDLVSTPIECFSRIAVFVGEEADAKTIADAVDQVSFERLRSSEESTNAPSGPFFRRGLVRRGADLTDEQQARILACHADVMRDLGYVAAL